MGIPAILSSVPSTTPYIQYIATNGQTSFPYPFPITQDSDLIVVDDGNTLNTDSGYSLSGVGNATGGNVTFTTGQTAGAIVTLYRDIPIERLTQISQNSGFSSTAFNAEYNNIYLILQQLQAAGSLALNIPVSNSPLPGTTLTPALYANKYLAFDSNGNPTPAVLTSSGTLTAPVIGGLLYPVTPAEQNALISPSTLVYPELDPRRYGADPTGASNSQAAIQNLFAVAEQYNSVMLRFPQGGTYRCDTGLTWDANKVGIDFQGSTIDFRNLTSGSGLAPFNTNTNANLRSLLNAVHPILNGYFWGPNGTVAGTQCLSLNDSSGVSSLANIGFKNCAFLGWYADIVLGVGAFCNSFEKCVFTVYIGQSTNYSVIQQNAAQSGERNVFINCQWFNKDLIAQNQGNALELFFDDCSFDYFNRAFSITGGGKIHVRGGHIEWSSDVDFVGYVAGPPGLLTITGTNFAFTGATKSVSDVFFSDGTCTVGGVFLRDITLGGSGAITSRLIGGTGNCRVDNVSAFVGGDRPTLAYGRNLLAYGDFESASFSDEWALSGTTPPAQSTTQAYSPAAYNSGTAYVVGSQVTQSSNIYYCVTNVTGVAPPSAFWWSLIGVAGTHSLAFAGSSSNAPSAVTTVACKPGQTLTGELQYMLTGFTGTSGEFLVGVNYLDKAGNAIRQPFLFTATANVANFTKLAITCDLPAPPGTVSVSVGIEIISTVSGSPIAYVDKVILNTD